MSDAIYMRQTQYLGKSPIEAYGQGGFRFSATSHKGGLLCLPSGFYALESDIDSIILNGVDLIIKHSDEIEVLLIGTGVELEPINQEIINNIKKYKISIDIMNTGACVRTYNILLSEDRAVAALLYPV